MVVEILLGVCGFNMNRGEELLGVGGFKLDRGEELTLVDADFNIQKSDMGGGCGLGKVDGIVTVEPFKESSEGVCPMVARGDL